jgi:hypothetical protein
MLGRMRREEPNERIVGHQDGGEAGGGRSAAAVKRIWHKGLPQRERTRERFTHVADGEENHRKPASLSIFSKAVSLTAFIKNRMLATLETSVMLSSPQR